ncbi:MAG: hypothetical protein ACKO9Q_09120, partial [Pirellula sp.]
VPSSWVGSQVSTKSTVTIETRILVLCDHQWYAFSYLWDQEQCDAVLVENQEQIDLQRNNPEERLSWVTTRSESCYECHNRGPIGFHSGMARQDALPESGLLGGVPVWGQMSDSGRRLVKEQNLGWMPLLVRSDSLRSQQYLDQGLGTLDFDWGWFQDSFIKNHVDLWYRNLSGPGG